MFRELFSKLLYGDPTPDSFIGVPQDIAYLRDHDVITAATIREVVCQSGAYNFLAPYFALKLLVSDPHAHFELMRSVVHSHHSGADDNHRASLVAEYLDHPSHDSRPSYNPDKLRQITERGPQVVNQAAERVVKETTNAGETPVLLAHSGLFALKHAVDAVKHGHGDALVVVPSWLDDQKGVGYVIEKRFRTTGISRLELRDFGKKQAYGLIDNTINTGQTFQNVKTAIRESNDEAVISERPMYITRYR